MTEFKNRRARCQGGHAPAAWSPPPLESAADYAAALDTLFSTFPRAHPLLILPAAAGKGPAHGHRKATRAELLQAHRAALSSHDANRARRAGIFPDSIDCVVVDIDAGGTPAAVAEFIKKFPPTAALPSGRKNCWHLFYPIPPGLHVERNAAGVAAPDSVRIPRKKKFSDGALSGDLIHSGNYLILHHGQLTALARARAAEPSAAQLAAGRHFVKLLRADAAPMPRAAPQANVARAPAGNTAPAGAPAAQPAAAPAARAPRALPNGMVRVTYTPPPEIDPDRRPRILIIPAQFKTAPAGDNSGDGQKTLFHLDRRADLYNAVHNHHEYHGGTARSRARRINARHLKPGERYTCLSQLLYRHDLVGAALYEKGLITTEADVLVLAVNLNEFIPDPPADDARNRKPLTLDELEHIARYAWKSLDALDVGERTAWREKHTRKPEWNHSPQSQREKNAKSIAARRLSSVDDHARALVMRAAGQRASDVAAALGVSRRHVYRWWKTPLLKCDEARRAVAMDAAGDAPDFIAAALGVDTERIALWSRAVAATPPTASRAIFPDRAARATARIRAEKSVTFTGNSCCCLTPHSTEIQTVPTVTESTNRRGVPRDHDTGGGARKINLPIFPPRTAHAPATAAAGAPPRPPAAAPPPAESERELPPPPRPDEITAAMRPAARAAPRQTALLPPPAMSARPPTAPRAGLGNTRPDDAAPRICGVAGCERKLHARGMCKTHAAPGRSPLQTIERGRPRCLTQTCAEPDCTAAPVARGLCNQHYKLDRWRAENIDLHARALVLYHHHRKPRAAIARELRLTPRALDTLLTRTITANAAVAAAVTLDRYGESPDTIAAALDTDADTIARWLHAVAAELHAAPSP